MTRKELKERAEAYSPDERAREGYLDGFKAAMAYFLKEFDHEPETRRKWGTAAALLRGMQTGDSTTVPIRNARDWQRWRVLCNHYNTTYGVYFKVEIEKTGRESVIITRRY